MLTLSTVCGVPPEYCEYGPKETYEKCKEWQLKHCPELVPKLKEQAEKAEAERKAKAEAAAAAAKAEGKDEAKEGETAPPAAAAKPKKKKKVRLGFLVLRVLMTDVGVAGEASVYCLDHSPQPWKAQVHHCRYRP